MTLSSILIQAKPKNILKLVEKIKQSDVCEYHLHDETKGIIIVTIEGKNTGEEIQKLTEIQAMDMVISAEMIYSHHEDELDQLRDNLEITGIPEWLNKENVDAKDIVYHGDLKRKRIR
ncbi:MAG: chaperone NapD [Bacteroidales bacterium]|nr:chaperone NapD [Bacteroidales bacterium]